LTHYRAGQERALQDARSHTGVALRRVLAVMTVLALPAAPVAAQTSPLVESYHHLYAGRPEQAASEFNRLRQEDSQSLPPWFGALFATMMQLEYDESLATDFERSIDAFIDHAGARHQRSADDTEALFYLAQAHLLRGSYRFNFDKGMWGAARDAARSKSLAETYIKRHPEHGDAYLALGLYNYFVDIAPNFVKVLRVLLFLPAGDRARGLRELERAAREGSTFAPFAETALAEIYGSLESRPRDAISIVEGFLARFGTNSEMRLTLAQLCMHPTVEQFSRAEREFSAVMHASAGHTLREVAQRSGALLGLASLRRAQWRIDEAIAILDDAVADMPPKPSWVKPAVLLRRANYKMLLNDASASGDVQRVLADPQLKTWHKNAQQLLAADRQRRKMNEGAIYTALIPGNRLVAEDRFDEAVAAYASVAAKYPTDWQVRYRRAYLEFARGHYESAAAGMQTIVSTSDAMPDWVKAAALLHLAYTHDLAGRRPQAITLYRRILDRYEDDGSAGAARVGLVAPFRAR
jgi:tetratricopeptide (TPR) repeat protein